MVPYVKKSFRKHYLNGLRYIERVYNAEEIVQRWDVDTPINDYVDKYERAYYYAMDMTQKELKQAVEGMYHNLNTLQSRSGN